MTDSTPAPYRRTEPTYPPGESSILERDVRVAFYLVRRYTSIAHLSGIERLLSRAAEAYEAFLDRAGGAPIRRAAASRLWDGVGALRAGLDDVGSGRPVGYRRIKEAVALIDGFRGPEFEFGECFVEVGFRYPPKPHLALYRVIDLALTAGTRFGWAFGSSVLPLVPLVLPPNGLPEELDPVPPGFGLPLLADQPAPSAGIYRPIHPRACPTYLATGMPVPTARIPTVTDREWASEAAWVTGQPPRWSETRYEAAAVPWQLHWADDRYVGGSIPDETAYQANEEIPSLPSLEPPVPVEEDYW